MNIDELVVKRKSVRSFQGMPVSEDLLNNLVDVAHQAPSWMNKQCWHFIIVNDSIRIIEIAKTSITNRWLKQAPSLILICADPNLSGNRDGISYYLVDAAIAMDHLILSATDKGLGTCWVGSFNEDKLKTILSIPPRIRVVALTPIGYPKKQNKTMSEHVRSTIVKSTKRKSLTEICHWNQW